VYDVEVVLYVRDVSVAGIINQQKVVNVAEVAGDLVFV